MRLSELDSSNYVASLSIESGLRKTWNPHDKAVIESKFRSLPHVKSKKAIMEAFSSDPVLRHILDREGAQRCYEKVKNFIKSKGHQLIGTGTRHLWLKSASQKDEGNLFPVKVCLSLG